MSEANQSQDSPDTIAQALQEKVGQLPQSPGVYLYKDSAGDIIYVGKAVRLRSRVQSYFRPDKNTTVKTRVLVKNIVDLEYILTTSGVEALILENNLIKKHRPKYNVRLRDDKNYLYLKITNEPYPQVELVRRMTKDGAKYFGPFTSGGALRGTLKLVEKIFPYRKCNQPYFRKLAEKTAAVTQSDKADLVRPCLEHQMGRCIACDPAVTEAEHAAVIDQVRRFFEGRVGEIAAELKQKMKQAAADMLFEKAARYRDQITQIEHVLEKQQAVMTDAEDRDVFGFALLRTKALVQLFKVRHGLLLGRETFTLDCAADCDPAEVLERTLTDYYERANEIPREVLLPVDFDGMIELESWLKDKRSDLLAKPSALELRMPQRGDKLQIVELANKNAEEQIKELMDQWLSTEQKKRLALKELQEALELPRRPERIECYDISHFGGEGTVASMVVMENGEPKKSDYRKFKMRHVSGGDDYAAMQEVFARRFDYLRESGIRLEGLTMRQASPKDMQAIAAVVAAENLDGEGMAPEQFVALKHAGEVIGFGRLRAYPLNAEDAKKYGDTNLTEIASLWVKPEMRGKKFGYKLLAELIKRAGSKVQYVIVPEALADYYAGFGFKKVTSPPPVLAAKETACASARGGARFVTLRFDKTIHRKADLSFKAIPDLVVVDGGKGQLSVTVAVLEFLGIAQKEDPPKAAKAPKKAKPASTPAKPAKPRSRWKRFTFPIVGLAKQAEEIFVPGEPLPVQLAADTQASLLLQAIRDEAHRFANTYQQKVRTKARLG